MKTTFLLLSLGFLGYTLYNRFYKTSNLAVSNGSGSQASNDSGNFNNFNSSPSSDDMQFDTQIEAQIERGEGLTDEAKVGIAD